MQAQGSGQKVDDHFAFFFACTVRTVCFAQTRMRNEQREEENSTEMLFLK